jgi:multidrug resistance efflux pump
MTRLLVVLGRFVVTSLAVGAAIGVGYRLWAYYMDEPWTRDGRVRAEVVQVAPDVSGFVSEVLVKDNQTVRRGDVVFRIDRARFVLALQQADAAVAGRRASLEQANADLKRYSGLSPGLVISQQRLEQVVATQLQAQAAYDQAVADRALAQLNLERTEVRASVNGTISNMELLPGNYITTGKGVMALVDSDTLHVDGYFEETKLPRIHVGDPVRVQLMGSPQVLRGRVESIAAGIEDRDRGQGASLLANVNPTFNWVRLAQRVPVRITLERTPEAGALVAGRTATVEVLGPRPNGSWTNDVASAGDVTARLTAVAQEVKTTLVTLLSGKAQSGEMTHPARQAEGPRQVAQADHDRQRGTSAKPAAQPRAERTAGRDQRRAAAPNAPSPR